MKSRDGLVFALLALLSNDATLALAQYVTTVTVSINTNPFCTFGSGIGAPGSGASGSGVSGFGNSSSGASGANGGGAGGSGSGSGYGGSNGTSSGTGSATSGSPSAAPIDTATGRYDALGYYAAPADGNLLGGPVSTSPMMTAELCGTTCQGYPYFALENGDECNCGSSPPSGAASPSPPSVKRSRATSGGCTPCAGNSAECCGAPGGYALVYRVTSDIEGSSVAVYGTTNSAGSVVEASSTSYSPIPSGSAVAYTSTESDGSVTVGSTTSYVAIASPSTYAYSTTDSDGSVVIGTTNSYAPIPSSSSASMFAYTTTSAGSVIVATSITSVPVVPVSTGSGSGSGSSGSYYSEYTLAQPAVTSIANIGGMSNTQADGDTATVNGTNTATAASGATEATETAANRGSISVPTIATTGGNSGTTGTAANGGSGGAAGSSSGTATTNGGATAVDDGGAEPTVESPTPSCVQSANYAGNNTKYIDYFGYTYDIRCNLDLQSMPTDNDAHAESFEDCLEYCSLLTDCAAVTYQDPPYHPNNLSNCYPKWTFVGYTPSAADGVYSGVNVNGASPGNLENQNLCTSDNNQGASFDGDTYYDDYGSAWTIGCDGTLAITGAAALSSTVTDTLAGCVDYCSRYDSCDMVNWTGPHVNGTLDDPNCFPASVIGVAGAANSAVGAGYATLDPVAS